MTSSVEDGRIAAGEFRLRYRIEGTGLPTMVIGSSTYYSRVFSEGLRRHLRMVFLDIRALARPPPETETSVPGLKETLEDTERAREQLGLESIVVIGHSGAALIALEYAKRFPKHVSHVVMIGIGPNLSAEQGAAAYRNWQESVDPERKSVQAENLRRGPEERWDQSFVRWYVQNGPKLWFDPHFDSAPLWEGVEFNQAVFNHVWGDELSCIDITRGLEKLDRPVFLALGRYDFVSPPPTSWDPLRPKFRDLTVRVFERSSHTPPLDEPELFDHELIAWLARKPEK